MHLSEAQAADPRTCVPAGARGAIARSRPALCSVLHGSRALQRRVMEGAMEGANENARWPLFAHQSPSDGDGEGIVAGAETRSWVQQELQEDGIFSGWGNSSNSDDGADDGDGSEAMSRGPPVPVDAPPVGGGGAEPLAPASGAVQSKRRRQADSADAGSRRAHQLSFEEAFALASAAASEDGGGGGGGGGVAGQPPRPPPPRPDFLCVEAASPTDLAGRVFVEDPRKLRKRRAKTDLWDAKRPLYGPRNASEAIGKTFFLLAQPGDLITPSPPHVTKCLRHKILAQPRAARGRHSSSSGGVTGWSRPVPRGIRSSKCRGVSAVRGRAGSSRSTCNASAARSLSSYE
eukprot:COSAG01_NODE_1365_length_10560_cov_38.008986_6_plen_347_part_00